MFRRRFVYSFLTVVFIVFLSTPAFGSGFALYEGSARGNVLGAGLTASADDPSAVFYNPAGITQLKGIQTMIGFTAITPMITVDTPGASNDFHRNWFFPPHAYYTQQLSDRFWFGVGEFSRFGLGTEFKPNWPGRYNSYDATIKTFELNPNIAYKISDKLSVAAGLSLMYLDLNLKRQLNTAALGRGDTSFELDGDSWGWGLNLAIHYKPTDWMQAGITYRSRVSQHVDGGVTTGNQIVIPPNPRLPAGVNITNMGAHGDLRLPDMVFAGLNFNATKTLSIGGGVYWTRWSTYDKLQVFYDRPFGTSGRDYTTSIKDWDDVWRFMIGVEWKALEWLDVRVSYAYDQAPEPDETVDYILPDDDRHFIGFGLGFHKDAWALDLSYNYMIIKDRDVTGRPADGVLTGKFKDGNAHLIGTSFSYKF